METGLLLRHDAQVIGMPVGEAHVVAGGRQFAHEAFAEHVAQLPGYPNLRSGARSGSWNGPRAVSDRGRCG
jgi:hypothetical protein